MIFSLFHILTYSRSYILPSLGYSSSSLISTQIQSFIKNYNDVFMSYAANFEFVLVFLLLIKFISFRSGTTFPFLFYIVFIKARYDQSFYMKSVVRSWEVRVDGIFSNPNVPAPAKQAWIQVKEIIKRITGAVTIAKPVAKKQS